MSAFEPLSLFGEPDRPQVAAPPPVKVQWTSYHPTGRVQCAHCVQIVHARRGAGPVDIRTARRRRTGPDGELLLCGDHAEAKHAADVEAGLVPAPRIKGRPPGRRTT
ncbi:hypothetical protein Aca07nite_27910 [Actinoplanes capillaceus]|uniref:Uncharacterized protein n=1 Tax=Actinoplanes campanulatus TaxID=113559 RepID=A0ABQ3WH06_9ACTN|nr:hypothetical protein [Actinoplanes capillaceus]GID45516.1 hypothetical protein Aca07nite_27910 [Actinoplanes capillaceus]